MVKDPRCLLGPDSGSVARGDWTDTITKLKTKCSQRKSEKTQKASTEKFSTQNKTWEINFPKYLMLTIFFKHQQVRC